MPDIATHPPLGDLTMSTSKFFSLPARIWIAGLALAAAFALPAHADEDLGGGPGHGMMAGMGGGMGPGMHGGPQRMERMLDSVNASAEQRTQIRSIMQAAMADMKTIRQNGAGLREQSRQLFTQPTVDARAAEALRQQKMALHDQASKRMLQAMLDVSRVLTPEQRKQIAERMAQRHSMMERHRAERQSLDKARQ